MPKSLEYLRSEAEREMVKQRIITPQYAIEATARMIKILLTNMAAHRTNPWQQKHGFSLEDVGQLQATGDIYKYVHGLTQLEKEQNLAELIAAAYNSPDIIVAVKQESITKDSPDFNYNNAVTHGNNARDVAEALCSQDEKQTRWAFNWAGEVHFNGKAEICKYREGMPYPESYNGQLIMAGGVLKIKASTKEIDKTQLIMRVIAELDEFIGEQIQVDGVGSVGDDMLPDLLKRKVRIFSETLCRLANGFSDETNNLYDEFIMPCTEQYVLDWSDYQNLPAKLLLVEGAGEAIAEIDLSTTTRGLLDIYFRTKDGRVDMPFEIDIRIGWYLDYSKVYGEKNELLIANFNGSIYPETIPCQTILKSTENGRKWRIIAGPSSSPMSFLKHPACTLIMQPDPEPCPPDCLSALFLEPEHHGEYLEGYNELYVLNDIGGICRVALV